MKKFLTVLLVIAVMFTFSFSSAFAATGVLSGTTGTSSTNAALTLEMAQTAAIAEVEAYVNLDDYALTEKATIIGLLSAAEAAIKAVTDISNLDDINDAVDDYKAAVDALDKTGTALAASADAYAKELAAYKALLEKVVGADLDVYVGSVEAENADFTSLTEAEQKALFDKYQAKLEKAAKAITASSDATVATDDYKATAVRALRAAAAQTTGNSYTVATQVKIEAALEEGIAAVNAATTVEEVAAVVEEYTGSGDYTAKVKSTSGLTTYKEAYGIITELVDSYVGANSSTISTWQELVDWIEANYDSKEIKAGSWEDAEDLINEVYANAENGASTENDAVTAAYNQLKGYTRGQVESVVSATNCYEMSTNQYFLQYVNEVAAAGKTYATAYELFVSKDQAAAKTAIAAYEADLELATSLAQVRELQATLVAALDALTLQADYDLDVAQEQAKEDLANLVSEWSKSGTKTKLYNSDTQKVIDLAKAAATAFIEDDDNAADLAKVTDASATDIPELALLKGVLTNDGYVSTATATADQLYQATATTTDLLKNYYAYLIADDFGFDISSDTDISGMDVFYDESTTAAQYYGNNAKAKQAAAYYNGVVYDATAAYASYVIDAYTSLRGTLDALETVDAHDAAAAYTKFETAMQALADNAADSKPATLTRINTANDKLNTVWDYYDNDWYTEEQEAVIFAAFATISDYMYEYNYALYYKAGTILGYTEEEVSLYELCKALFVGTTGTKAALDTSYGVASRTSLIGTDILAAYSLSDQAAIKKAIVAADNAIDAATTVADKKAAALAGVEALKAFTVKDAEKNSADNAETLAALKTLAANFFTTYEDVTFTSDAADKWLLRDDIIAAMADDSPLMTAEEVVAWLEGVTTTVRTAKTAKGNVKVTVTTDYSKLTDAGYTLSYKFYKATTANLLKNYKLALTKDVPTYTNTKLVKGKNYYKAVVVVKDAAGNVVAESKLINCKAGYRTIK